MPSSVTRHGILPSGLSALTSVTGATGEGSRLTFSMLSARPVSIATAMTLRTNGEAAL